MEHLEYEDHEEPKGKKIILHVFSVFVLIMFLLYVLWPSDVLQGFVVSQSIDDYVLTHKEKTITFDSGVYTKLVDHYLAYQKREIKACLLGNIEGDLYSVTDIVFPKVVDASVVHIRAMQCPERTIVELHSHPIYRCVASRVDINGLRMKQKKNPDLLLMVMCSEKRFAVYSSLPS